MPNVVVTGLTAARMIAIEASSIVSGVIQGDNLILTRFGGGTVNAGNVRGPQGIQGPPGSINVSPAGGDLTGNYPSPTISALAVTDAKVALANKDGLATVASMRTLGTGTRQAAAGNHDHGDSGWEALTTSTLKAGDAPFTAILSAGDYVEYRKAGQLVHLRIGKTSTASVDKSGSTTGNFTNIVVTSGIPPFLRPTTRTVMGSARIADSPTTFALTVTGDVIWSGGFPRVYPSGSTAYADFIYYTDS